MSDTARCSDADAYFTSCGVAAPVEFAELCRSAPDSVTEILTLSCDELVAALDELGKADLPGFSREAGEPCTFNIQCDWSARLVCRPGEWNDGEPASVTDQHRCLPWGRNGDRCDDASDCGRGDPCTLGVCAIHDRGGH